MFKSNSFLKVELISKQITDGKPNFSELVLSFWWTDSKNDSVILLRHDANLIYWQPLRFLRVLITL